MVKGKGDSNFQFCTSSRALEAGPRPRPPPFLHLWSLGEISSPTNLISFQSLSWCVLSYSPASPDMLSTRTTSISNDAEHHFLSDNELGHQGSHNNFRPQLHHLHPKSGKLPWKRDGRGANSALTSDPSPDPSFES